MPATLRLALPAIALVWLNAYISRDFFRSGFTGYVNSMQGFWAGLARLASHGHWLAPHWWPWHDGGSPFEWTYQPVIPGLAALWAHLASVEPIRGVQAASGLVYIAGPAALFLFCAVATRRVGWSFATAAAWSLLSPADWVLPDAAPSLESIANARRLYLMAVWDETPHYGALALLPVALLFASEGMRTGRLGYWLALAVTMALSLMTSAFGATTLAIGMFCLLLAAGRPKHAGYIAGAAALAWALTSPALPPSLIATIRANSLANGDSGREPLVALAVVAAGAALILLISRRLGAAWWPKFVFLFAWIATAIPALFQYGDRFFIPQPGRYKVEAEMGLILAGALALQFLLDRTPKWLRLAVALVALALATQIVIRHRRYEKELVRDRDPRETLEYQVAAWTQANLPHARVALPGTLAIWFNAFADGRQFSGGSYPTAYNRAQQTAWNRWLTASTPAEAADAAAWLKAFGTYAFAVPKSGEFWNALNHPDAWLPCDALANIAETTICRVPGARASLAHVLPREALATRADIVEVRRYADALDGAGEAPLTWDGSSSATVRAPPVRPGEAVSVQISWHPGWKATANGRPAAVRADGLGLTVVEPECEEPCEIRLQYAGGTELLLCHGLRWTVILGLAIAAVRLRLSRPASRGMVPATRSGIP